MDSNPEILEKLAKLDIFLDFAEKTPENFAILERIAYILEVKQFESGDIIIQEGSFGNSLYILQEGQVQVIRSTPESEQFAVENLSAQQNVFFGEVALIDHDKRSASVKALTDCKTLVLSAEKFMNLCEENPLLGFRTTYRIAKRIGSSLRKSNRDLLTLYQALLDEVVNPD